MDHDLTNSEFNKSLKVLTKWNLLIKIYLMLKDNINISLRYDSKNDRKTKGLKLSILLMQHRCIRVKEGTQLKQDTFSLFEATTVDT